MAKGGITHDFSSVGPDPSRIVKQLLGRFQKAITTPGMTQLQAKELYLKLLASVGKSGAVPSAVLKQLAPAAQGLMRQGGFEQALTMIREQGNMIAGQVVPPLGLGAVAAPQNAAAMQQASQAVQGGAGGMGTQLALTGGIMGGPWAARKLKAAAAARAAATANPTKIAAEASEVFKPWLAAGKLSQQQASDLTTYLTTTGEAVPKTIKAAQAMLIKFWGEVSGRGGSYGTASYLDEAAAAAKAAATTVAKVAVGKKGRAAHALTKLLGSL